MDLTTPKEFTQPVPAKRIRRLASAFSGAELEDALATMRRTGAHVAKVFDPDGNTTACCSWRTSSKNSSAKYRTPPAPSHALYERVLCAEGA
jgi:hypothetical protein